MRQIYLLLVVAIIFLGGCNSTNTTVHYLTDADSHGMDACDVIVHGMVTDAYVRSNLTAAEDFLGPEPTNPKNGYMTVFTVRVDKVIKGNLSEHELKFRAYDPATLSRKTIERGIIPVTKGNFVEIGWKQYFPGQRAETVIRHLDAATP